MKSAATGKIGLVPAAYVKPATREERLKEPKQQQQQETQQSEEVQSINYQLKIHNYTPVDMFIHLCYFVQLLLLSVWNVLYLYLSYIDCQVWSCDWSCDWCVPNHSVYAISMLTIQIRVPPPF